MPRTGPYLLVANHAGLGAADILCLICCFAEQTSNAFPAAMVHPVSFNSWPAGVWMRNLGAIPSTYEAAFDALDAGVPVLSFPGGDLDATRPVWRAFQVDFGGRKGFLEIARQARVPIVPLGICGTSFVAPVLFRSRVLSRLLYLPKRAGVNRYPITVLGVLGALAWTWLALPYGLLPAVALGVLWMVSPLSQIPWIPWSVCLRVGSPLDPDLLFPDDSEDSLERAYAVVHGAVQELVTKEACADARRALRLERSVV